MKSMIFVIAALMATSANAQSTERERAQIVGALADLLSVEEMCGMSYNKDAVNAWIEANIPPRDEKLESILQTTTAFKKRMLEDKSIPELAKKCVDARNVATQIGFIK